MGEAAGGSPSPELIQSVVTAHDVLGAIAAGYEPQSLSEIARALQLTVPRVFRHLATLTALGLVERVGDEPTYRLGWRLAQLGDRAARQHQVVPIAYPVLAELRRKVRSATMLVRRQDDRMAMIWLSLEDLQPPHMNLPAGTILPLHASASGRVLMAFAPEAERARLVEGLQRESASLDPRMDLTGLAEDLVRIRRERFEIRPWWGQIKLTAASAPVLDHRGEVLAAVTVLGLFEEGAAGVIRPAIIEAAAEISAALGGGAEWEGEAVPAPRRPGRPR